MGEYLEDRIERLQREPDSPEVRQAVAELSRLRQAKRPDNGEHYFTRRPTVEALHKEARAEVLLVLETTTPFATVNDVLANVPEEDLAPLLRPVPERAARLMVPSSLRARLHAFQTMNGFPFASDPVLPENYVVWVDSDNTIREVIRFGPRSF